MSFTEEPEKTSSGDGDLFEAFFQSPPTESSYGMFNFWAQPSQPSRIFTSYRSPQFVVTLKDGLFFTYFRLLVKLF